MFFKALLEVKRDKIKMWPPWEKIQVWRECVNEDAGQTEAGWKLRADVSRMVRESFEMVFF